MPIIGSGTWRYDFQRDWARLPRGWNFGETGHPGPPRTSVQGATAANGDVYVLCRAAHPVLVFDPEGRFITSWGEGQFSAFVHGLTIDRAGRVWIADSGLHTVTRHEPDGTLLQTLGTPNGAAPTFYGKPFNMPTGTTFTSDGDVFVSDGYGNRRVHRFSPTGELKHAWGEPGSGPGQFALVHFIGADAEDRLYVCDRENHRIQLFTTAGDHLTDWTGFHMPSDLAFGGGRSTWQEATGCRSGLPTGANWRSSAQTSRTRARSTFTASGWMPTRTSTLPSSTAPSAS